MTFHGRVVVMIGLLLLAGAGVATADWLVTEEGAEIETRGPWKVKGAVVVFTNAQGTLSSMRVSELDLEASDRRTNQPEAAAVEAEEEPAKKESVLVLTDKDISRATRIGPAATLGAGSGEGEDAGEESGEGAKTPAEAPPQAALAAGAQVNQPFHVLAWKKSAAPDGGVEITGTLQNGGGLEHQQITATVTLLDADGNFAGEGTAFVTSPVLRPSAATTFKAILADANAEAGTSIRLEVRSREVPAPNQDLTQSPPEDL